MTTVERHLQMARAANEAIGDVLKIIGRSPIVLEDVFDALLSNALRLCSAELGILFLHTNDGCFRAVYTKGVPEEFQKWLDKQGSFKVNAATGLGRIERHKEPLHIYDVRSEDAYAQDDPLRVATADLGGARTFIAIPMLSGDELKGAFTIYRQTVRAFDEEHVKLVERFADQAVIALENARLLKDARELAESLAETNRNLEKIVNEQIVELEKHSRLSRFLPEKIADLILSSGDESKLRSHRQTIAIIFCDLRRFTRFSESAEPEEVTQVLEAFHSETSEIASHSGGTIVDRSGDKLMIVLNDPIPVEEPAKEAIRLATALRSKLGELCEKWQKYEYDLGFGIGMSYGYATLGIVGSKSHQIYAAIGTAVNIAARLCSYASDGEVLLTQRLYTEAGNEFEFEDAGNLELKGVSRPIHTFRFK